MKTHSRSITNKRNRGQSIIEFLSVIPLMFIILGMVASAGWWTYGRMNALTHSYFIAMEISSYNSISRLSTYDSSFESVTSGKPYWFDVRAFGSDNTYVVVFGVPAADRVAKVFFVRGTIMTTDPDKLTTDPSQYYIFWDSPIYNKYGEPKATLIGTFCWFCSSQPPPGSK
jgi:hypothetical protein